MRRRESRRKLELDQLLEPDDPEILLFLTDIDRIGKDDRFGLTITGVFTARHELNFDPSTGIAKSLLRSLERRDITESLDRLSKTPERLRAQENVDVLGKATVAVCE